MPAVLANRKNVFAAIRDQDILVHHPYESFGSVVQFIEQASEDPQVLAIKMTLYRTADANPIITALARAAEIGKQVTALVELQARLDEENNIDKARMLQKAGVHVVYGIVGLKTHCKAALVVRREHDGIRRYVHLGTGNYNPMTGRQYTDLSFFTCRPEFGEDASSLFNLLTGYSQGNQWNKLIVAPKHLANRLGALIDRERTNAEAGLPARIIAKMNSLVDPKIIELLYRASQAGVRIDLIVRGTCCLRPGSRGSPTTSGSSASSTSTWNTRGSPTSRTATIPRSSSRRPTGCRGTSAAASRSCSRSRTLSSSVGWSTASWAWSWPTTSRRASSSPTGPTAASPRPARTIRVIRCQVEFQNMAIELCETSPISQPATALAGASVPWIGDSSDDSLLEC